MPLTPVQKELGKVATDFRRLRILLGLTYCWLAGIAAGLVLLALGRGLGIHIPHALQIVMLLTLAGAVCVFWRESRTDIALREIARQVEHDDQHLISLLLAAVVL